jgi:uncharacterized protein YsxB (DUF464 family)
VRAAYFNTPSNGARHGADIVCCSITLAVFTDVPIAGPVGEFALLNRTIVGTLVVTLASAPSLYVQPAGVASTITLEV